MKMTKNALISAKTTERLALVPGGPLPALVRGGGRAARTAWDDFFEGRIANEHTRAAYERAVRNFLAWAENHGRDLPHITAGDVGKYLRKLSGARSSPLSNRLVSSSMRLMNSACLFF